jgi:hypothetical protein
MIYKGPGFLAIYDLAPPPPPDPIPPNQSVSWSGGSLRKRDNLLTEEGEREEFNHTTARKPGSQ